MYTKKELDEIFSEGVFYRVVFTKVNGEKREMYCTKDPMIIGETDTKTSNRKQNDDVFPVFDVDKNAWRSFRIDNLISVVHEG